MNILFDAHCDTLQKICDTDRKLRKNDLHLDLERLKNREIGSVHVFAAFVDKKNDVLPLKERCIQLITKYREECMQNTDLIEHCNSIDDIYSAIANKKVAGLLSIEGGEALEGKLENLVLFHKMGVRIITLCWNYQNEIADGVMSAGNTGLTDFGKAVVSEMNRLGMLIDVSHMSEKSFWDVMEYSPMPISATHSNAKKIKNHPRNLNDAQIKAIIEKNGCIGINIYPEFVSDNGCDICDIVRHIEYIMALGGENNIGIGSDFDGIDTLPQSMNGAEDLEKIFDSLLRLGYSDGMITKLAGGNFLRLIKNVIG